MKKNENFFASHKFPPAQTPQILIISRPRARIIPNMPDPHPNTSKQARGREKIQKIINTSSRTKKAENIWSIGGLHFFAGYVRIIKIR